MGQVTTNDGAYYKNNFFSRHSTLFVREIIANWSDFPILLLLRNAEWKEKWFSIEIQNFLKQFN